MSSSARTLKVGTGSLCLELPRAFGELYIPELFVLQGVANVCYLLNKNLVNMPRYSGVLKTAFITHISSHVRLDVRSYC